MHIYIHSYLTLSLVKDAATMLPIVEASLGPRNWIEVWRRLSKHVYSSSDLRRHALRGKVLHPAQAKGLHDVKMAIGNWETPVRDYNSVGGMLSDDGKRIAIIRMLPDDVAEDAMLTMDNVSD